MPRSALTITGYYLLGVLGWSNVAIPALVRTLEQEFRQDDAAISLLYFLSSCLLTVSYLVGGFLTERVGRRSILVAGVCLAGSGLIVSGCAPEWTLFLTGSCLVAIGAGLIDPQVIALFLDFYPGARGAALNVLNAFFSVGSLVAPLVIGLSVTSGASWRLLILVTGGACIVTLPALALLHMPSGHRNAPGRNCGTSELERSAASSLPFICLAMGMALYTGAMMGVSNWLVRFLVNVPLSHATLVLSAFWMGLTVSRLVSNWVAEALDYSVLVISCVVLASLALAGAVLSRSFALTAVLFTLTGVFYGPVFPMLIAIGGTIYPHRISILSGGLMTAAGVGLIAYPPLMGVLAAGVGLRGGMLGASILGIPVIACVFTASHGAWRQEAH